MPETENRPSTSSASRPISKAPISFANAKLMVACGFDHQREDAQEDWPRESLDDLIAVPNDAGPPLFIDLLAFLARKRKIDRVIALEEFDVVTAALMREHLCLPGLSSSGAKIFRDKLSMAVHSQRAGINVPEFVPLVNAEEVDEFMQRFLGHG
jgi:hypothetical protein